MSKIIWPQLFIYKMCKVRITVKNMIIQDIMNVKNAEKYYTDYH